MTTTMKTPSMCECPCCGAREHEPCDPDCQVYFETPDNFMPACGSPECDGECDYCRRYHAHLAEHDGPHLVRLT